MEQSNTTGSGAYVFVTDGQRSGYTAIEEVYRVIDDGDCILTTVDAKKALVAMSKLIDKHDISACWVDIERLK